MVLLTIKINITCKQSNAYHSAQVFVDALFSHTRTELRLIDEQCWVC